MGESFCFNAVSVARFVLAISWYHMSFEVPHAWVSGWQNRKGTVTTRSKSDSHPALLEEVIPLSACLLHGYWRELLYDASALVRRLGRHIVTCAQCLSNALLYYTHRRWASQLD